MPVRLIATPLLRGDLDSARAGRRAASFSRDTAELDEVPAVARGAIESVLGKTVPMPFFAALFWFCACWGRQAVLAYRLINTLDAMWGYKNERYLRFRLGWRHAPTMSSISSRRNSPR